MSLATEIIAITHYYETLRALMQRGLATLNEILQLCVYIKVNLLDVQDLMDGLVPAAARKKVIFRQDVLTSLTDQESSEILAFNEQCATFTTIRGKQGAPALVAKWYLHTTSAGPREQIVSEREDDEWRRKEVTLFVIP